jgi:hypothetical protein
MTDRVIFGSSGRRLILYVCSAQTYPPRARAYGWCELRIDSSMPRSMRRALIAMALRSCRHAYRQQIALG